MLNEDQVRQIQAKYKERGKIAAVKLHMDFTGESLRDAKLAVESMLADFGDYPSSDGLEVANAQMDQILDAIQQGHKIEAIKIYRQSKDCSLKESKEFVEKLMATLEIEDPDSVGKPGCSAAMILMLGSASGLAYWWSSWFG